MRLYLLIPLIFVLTAYDIQAQTTYCFGSLCEQNLSAPEAAMKEAAQPLGDKLIYDYTQGGQSYDVRHYKVPDADSFGTGTEIFNSLPDYSQSGSAQCPKSLSINEGGWEFKEWVSTDTNTISRKYEKNVSVGVTYGLYEPFTDVCTMKNFDYAHIYRKYDHFQCEGGYTIDYGGSGEGATPVCKSDLTGFLQEYQCQMPFEFEESTRECVKYCPPTASILDLQLGICKAPPGEKDPQNCAATAGNPIQVGTGEKIQPQSPDYSGSGLFPLRFVRNYKSQRAPEAANPVAQLSNDTTGWTRYIEGAGYSGASVPGWAYQSTPGTVPPVGYKQWMHSYQLSLVAYPDESKVVLVRANGDKRYFSVSEDNISYTPDNLTGDKVTKFGSDWLYTSPEGVVEHYNSLGQLTTISNQQGLSQSLAYNSDGLLVTVTDPAARQLTLAYDSSKRLSALTDPDGNVTRYEYGDNGNLVKVIFPDDTAEDATDNPSTQYSYTDSTNPFALTALTDENEAAYASWTYGSDGRATGSANFGGHKQTSIAYNDTGAVVTEANGQTRTLSFDSQGLLTSVTGGNCGQCSNSDVASYGYDANNQLVSETDFNGVETRYEYNDRGLQTKRSQAFGTALVRVTTTQWHSDLSLPVKVISPTTQTDYVYGVRGRLESVTQTDLMVAESPSRVTTYGYNETGLLISIDGPRSDVSDTTTFAYNASYDLISTTDAAGNVTQITDYDAHGQPTRILDANGIVTTLAYDVRNRLISQVVDDNVTSFSYDNLGQLTRITLPSGALTNYSYNGARLLTAVSDGLGNSVNYSHDVMGNVTKVEVKDPQGILHASQQQVFDGLNRLTAQIDGLNQTTSLGYDAVGNQVSLKTPALKETRQVYDALNRLTQTIDAKSGSTLYGYDAADNLTSVTAPNSAATTYHYDGFGNLLSQTSPDTGTTVFTYDVAGNQVSKTDAKNISVSYRSDALNRLTAIDYADDSLDTSLSYDGGINGKGRLYQITDGSGTTTYSYNTLGQVSAKTTTISGKSFTLSYGYNSAGQLTQITQPSGRVVSLTRDSQGQVSGISELNAGKSQNLLTSAAYVPFGGAKSFTLGNGKVVAKSHNVNGQLTGIDVSGVYQSQLTYNSDSNITQLQNSLQPSLTQTFSYDDLDRLTQAYGSYGGLAYGYDSAGNRLSKTDNSQVTSLTYTTNSNQLNSPYLHDANGNRSQDSQRSFSYGEHNRLTQVVNEQDKVKTTYLYNGLGQRVKKTNVFGTIFYLYDEQGLLIAEADDMGKVTREYVYFEGQPLVMLVGE